MAVTLPGQAFMWGPGGSKVTPESLAQQQQIIDALMATGQKLPTNFWEGAQGFTDTLVGNTLQQRHDDALKKQQDDYASQFDALGSDPSTAVLEQLAGNPYATDQQSAVVKALLGQNLKNNDPDTILDRTYKQAQIDALSNKPGQPLVNAGSGEIYDPNNQRWISAPNNSAIGGPDAPVVTLKNDGTPDPASQDAFLKSIPDPQYAQTVKGVANYEIDPRVASKRGDAQLKLIQDAKAFDPTYDASQFPARMAARKSFTSGTAATALNSANLVIGHLNELRKASAALGNSGFTPMNWITNQIKGNTDNPDVKKYQVAQQASADELAKVFKGSGTSDVESIAGWMRNLDVNSGPDQQKAAIGQAITLLQSRVAALRDQYQNAMGKPADFQFLNEHSAQALTEMGIDPADVDPNYKPPDDGDGTPSAPKMLSKDSKAADAQFEALPSGAHFVGPDGVERIKP